MQVMEAHPEYGMISSWIDEFITTKEADNWDSAADSLQRHLELARDKAESVIKVIRLW